MRKGMKMLIVALAVTGLLVTSFVGVAMAAGPADADADGVCPYSGERQGQGGMHGFHGVRCYIIGFGQRRKCAGQTLTIGLVASGTIGNKQFFAVANTLIKCCCVG